MTVQFNAVPLVQVTRTVPVTVLAVAVAALLIGLALRMAGLVVVPLSALFAQSAALVNDRFEHPQLALVLAAVLGVLQLASMTLVWSIRASDHAATALLTRGGEPQ